MTTQEPEESPALGRSIAFFAATRHTGSNNTHTGPHEEIDVSDPSVLVQIPAVRTLVDAATRLLTATPGSHDYVSAVATHDEWFDALEVDQ